MAAQATAGHLHNVVWYLKFVLRLKIEFAARGGPGGQDRQGGRRGTPPDAGATPGAAESDCGGPAVRQMEWGSP